MAMSSDSMTFLYRKVKDLELGTAAIDNIWSFNPGLGCYINARPIVQMKMFVTDDGSIKITFESAQTVPPIITVHTH